MDYLGPTRQSTGGQLLTVGPRARKVHPPLLDTIFVYRDRFALIVGILLGVLVLLLVAVLFSWIAYRPLPVSAIVSDDLTALLALGTITLAYAAGFQAWSTERKRRGDLRPHLDIQVLKEPRGPVCWHMFMVDETASGFYIRLTNFGPGIATNVRLTGFDWDVRADASDPEFQALQRGGPPRPPIQTPPGERPSEVIKDPIWLAAGERFEVRYQLRIPPLPDFGAAAAQAATSFRQQVLLVATCEDVEDMPVAELRAAFRLDLLPSSSTPGGRSLRSHGMVWRRLPPSQAASLPVRAVPPD